MFGRAGLPAIFLVVFLDMLGFSLVLPFLAELARAVFHTTPLVGTLLASVYSLMQFLFVPVWGRMSDRIGRRPVLLWSVLVTALTMFGLGAALVRGGGVFWLFVPRVAGGIATANMGTASAYIVDVTPPQDRARGMGILGVAFGLGYVIGPVIGGGLSQIALGGRTGAVPCFVAGTLSLVNFAWAYFTLPESLPPELRNRTQRSLAPLNVAAARETLSRPGIAVPVLVNFAIVVSFAELNQTFRYYSKDEFAMSAGDTGLALTLVGVISVGMQAGMRVLSKRFDDATLIRFGTFCQCAAFGGLAAAPSVGRLAFYLATGLLAVGNGLTQPSIPAYISKRTESTAQGETLGTNQASSALGNVFGPALGGWLYGAWSPRAPYVAGALGMAVATGVAFALARTATKDQAQ